MRANSHSRDGRDPSDPELLDPELLDPELWDAPRRLSPRDCRDQAGLDERLGERRRLRPDDLEQDDDQ